MFLGSELLFLIVTMGLMLIIGMIILKKRTLKGHYIFLTGLILTVLSTLFLILFTRILTGEGHLWLFGAIAVVSIILLLLVELMWLILGGRDVPWVGRMIWTRYEFEQLAPTVNKILQLVGALTLVIYPVYIGLGYFGDEFGGGEWSRYVLRSTLIMLFGVAWLVQLPAMLYVITSRNVMEGTRSRLFMVQLGQTVSLLVILSVFIWTINSAGATIPILGEYFVFSSTIGYAMGTYLLVILIIPYLIGHYRAKRWVEHLDTDRKDLIDEVTKGLSSLNLERAINALDESENSIRASLKGLRRDKSMNLAIQVTQTDDDQLFVQRLALEEGIECDPRFVHSERLEELVELIEDCRTELSKKEQESEKREVLKACVELLGKKKEKEVSNSGSTKAWVLIILATVATSIANPVLSAVGKFITAKLGFT